MIILAFQVDKVRLDAIGNFNLHLVLVELIRFYGYYITLLRVAPRWWFQFPLFDWNMEEVYAVDYLCMLKKTTMV